MKSKAQQNLERLNLYGLVQGLSYVVRLDDLKTAQHLRARLAWVLRQPSGRAKRLHAELKQLFAISGVWVRNAGDRHDTKRQILQIIRRIIPRLKVPRTEFLKPAPNDYLQRWSVSKRVNSSKADADDATLIERIDCATTHTSVP